MELNTINDQAMDWLDEADFQVVAVSIDDTRSAAQGKSARQRQRLERLHRPLRQESGFQACDEREHGTACFRSGWGGKIVYNHTGYTPGSEAELLEVIKGLQ